MTTTLASLGIDPNNSPYRSADLLLAGKLIALYEYAKSLEEECARKSTYIDGLQDIVEIDSEEDYNRFAEKMLADLSNPDRNLSRQKLHEPSPIPHHPRRPHRHATRRW